MSISRCKCKNCKLMPSQHESQCCWEIPAVREKKGTEDCITKAFGFAETCLHPEVLRAAYLQFGHHYPNRRQDSRHE